MRLLSLILTLLALLGCSSSSYVIKQKSERLGTHQEIKAQPEIPSFAHKANETPAEPRYVALLLPLSGTHAEIGKSLLDAATLALFEHDDVSHLVLLPIDSKESSNDAKHAAEEARTQGASLILGPVFSRATRDVLAATQGRAPVVSFSNDSSLAGTGAFILGISPLASIDQLTQYALRKNIRDFALLLPEDNFGKDIRKQVEKNVLAAAPASILGARHYSTSAKVEIARDTLNAVRKDLETLPGTAPRALILPEGGTRLKNISKLVPQITPENVPVQIIGSAQWDMTDMPDNDALEGAWFAAPSPTRMLEFEKKFYQRFGYKPHRLASLAYDAVSLAAILAKQYPGNSALNTAMLTDSRGFSGVNGVFRFKENGLNERGLTLLKIRGHSFEVLESAPEKF